MKYHYQIYAFLIICILTRVAASVTLPISSNGRTYTVKSSSLLQELQDNNRSVEPSDNSYDEPLLASTNNSTLATAGIMKHILHDGDDLQKTFAQLGRVTDPETVAQELESAVKYLSHQADLAKEKGVNEDGSSDITRILDGFVFLNHLYDSLVRPGSGGGGEAPVTVVIVDAIISPWFNVNEQRNEMSLTFTLVQNWTDKRLAYRSRLKHPEMFEYVTLTSYMNMVEIWLPDSTVLNEKRSFKHDVTPVRITPFGGVSREQRMGITVNCAFYENKMFPFDSPTCSVNLASFSWNASQIQYKWGLSSTVENLVGLESNGLTISSVQKLTKNFLRDGLLKSSLSLEFRLERKLHPYITKLYMPLGCFCLISIAGLIKSVGPEIGAALSYFMFGLMNIFMAISFNGPDFNWGYERTRLDSYYVLCVMTVLATGIINMCRLKRRGSTSKSNNVSHESYEMHTDDNPGKNIRTNGSSTPSSTVHNRTRLWTNSDNFSDDEDEEGVEQIPSGILYRCVKSAKRFVRRVFYSILSCCIRINDFSLTIMMFVFISWNFYYWISNLSKQDYSGDAE